MSSFEIIPWNGSANQPHELFVSEGYTAGMRAAYGYEYLAVGEEGTTILPFTPVVDCYGSRLVCLPFCDYVSLTAESQKLLSAIDLLKTSYPRYKIILKSRGMLPELEKAGFEISLKGVNHRIPLSLTPDALFQRTNRAFRKGVNKAARQGVTVEPYATSEALDIFYHMLTQLRRAKFSLLPHPRIHYASLFDAFISKGSGAIWIARLGDTPIAAAFFMESNGVLYDKMGVSDWNYQEYRPNNLLLWEALLAARKAGIQAMDMGYTNELNEGVLRFKEGLGGTASPVRYYTYYPEGYERSAEVRVSETISRLIKAVVSSNASDDVVHSVSETVYSSFC